ncbi:MAG: tRNA uridine-5-carboxymethylaminomethyl(34) synthesis GTPase MnmE [Deltaproteobacteria bacterium]|nr:tRNA uridine-5-carboxymethylaminomethyl(34) synthesis GTPase MnmE [Deltaproteobacteria bacterium]MCK5710179.1 tRNA uridine-5-carboxymethylaminomethyl(34) synthesis GTPase MnmE [Deltaproteobacteria bacterium]
MKLNSPYDQDTIAAIATAQGDGGIAVIRISGKKSLDIINLIFSRNRARAESIEMESHRMYHGHIADSGSKKIVDEVLCVLMKSPNSYTGEDMAEIHSHGGHLVPKNILSLLFKLGARPANPGEFTLRAYLNGKMDLAQAEAVTDVVNAQTEQGLRQAELQLEGALSRRIDQYKETLIDLLAEIETQVDFPEEDIDPIVKDRLIYKTNELLANIAALLNSYEEGRIIKYGVNTVILGKPNVGKSSLLNQLIMKERAIVSPQPGTTRDFIEENIDVRGIALKLTDTAGIRGSTDEIENIGVELARKKGLEAELIIVVIDASDELDEDDIEVLERIGSTKAVLALNKSDIEPKITENDLAPHISKNKIVKTSAKLGTGIEELKDNIRNLLTKETKPLEGNEIVLTELRHKIALERSIESLKSFLKAMQKSESPEFLALDLRVALDSLGEITGEVTTEDILGRIFSKFCIGK